MTRRGRRKRPPRLAGLRWVRNIGVVAVLGLVAMQLPGSERGGAAGTVARPIEPSQADRPQGRDAFYDWVAPMAQASQRRYGVPASVTIAQAAVESGYGNGQLVRDGKNYFGIRCPIREAGSAATGCVPHYDDGYVGPFRSYPSIGASFDDHGHFLRTQPRYRAAFGHADPAGFVRELAAAGYATDPQYAAKLIGLINRDHLDRYDRL